MLKDNPLLGFVIGEAAFIVLFLTSLAVATTPAEAPGVKHQDRVPQTPPAQTLRVVPVPPGYVRDGYRYGGSNGDAPFFMDREWFYEGTIQGKA